jgi:hypothetical protein
MAISYRCSWQDFRGWRERWPDKKPPVQYLDFDSVDEANARKRELQASGLTACITDTPAPRKPKK